jgi:L-fucose mutarotase
LANAGHNNKVLIADANFPYATLLRSSVNIVYLNYCVNLLTVEQVLRPLLDCMPISDACIMEMDSGERPPIYADFRGILRPDQTIESVRRSVFYELCGGIDVAVAIATGETRPYANILLTVGAVFPGMKEV